MRPARVATVLVALVVLALASGKASAENPDTFGVQDPQVVTLSHFDFLPLDTGSTYETTCCVGDSYRHPIGGVAYLFKAIDAGLVPNGASLERIDFLVGDSMQDADADIQVFLCRTWIHVDGSTPNGDCPFTASTSGSPGDTVVTLMPSMTVQYTQDLDGDTQLDDVSYVLLVGFGTNGHYEYSSGLRLRGARILYRRQISPAPETATFNDVPTSHPFFQYIETLAASGISAGCGAGNYCPDAPLTRGQMAVFLAKALGLYWPAK